MAPAMESDAVTENTNIASRGATMAVDWEQRVDFDRLRSARLERTKAALRAFGPGRVAALRPEQPSLRHQHRDRHVGARQEHPLRARLPRRRSDPLGLRLGGSAPPDVLRLAARVELARLGHTDARRHARRDRRSRRARQADPRRAGRARARRRARSASTSPTSRPCSRCSGTASRSPTRSRSCSRRGS